MYYEHVKKKGITMIEEMIVDKKYRGKGVGSSLIREVVKYSKKIGSLAIFVTAGGKKAGKFYEKAGFEQLSNYYVKPL
jgi:GNAT superfamily N-acetyltransferase